MITPIHFAPLQGYTDAVYRRAHARVFGGVEAYYTPFVRLEKEGFRKKDLRDIAPAGNDGCPVVPQLIAATPDEFRALATLFQEQGYTQTDINLGCPFPMQVRQHRGAGLLPFPREVEALLQAVQEFPALQFSVKMRLGWEDASEWEHLLPLLNELPLHHVALHPRVGVQQYKGSLEMEGFARFYEACKHPLLFNGDLLTVADIHSVTDRFPRLQGVMIGRGLLAHPQLAAEYAANQCLTSSELKDKLQAFHALLFDEYSARLEGGDHQVLAKMKALWDYLLPDADKKLRKKVVKSGSLSTYTAAVKALLAE